MNRKVKYIKTQVQRQVQAKDKSNTFEMNILRLLKATYSVKSDNKNKRLFESFRKRFRAKSMFETKHLAKKTISYPFYIAKELGLAKLHQRTYY
jgi:hypothetical protein